MIVVHSLRIFGIWAVAVLIGGCTCIATTPSLVSYPTPAVYKSGYSYDFLDDEQAAGVEVLHLVLMGVDRYIFESPYQILVSGGAMQSKKDVLRYFISTAHRYGIQVEAGYGEKHWWKAAAPNNGGPFDQGTFDHIANNILTPLKDYQTVAPEERFDAIHYDIEFWRDPAYRKNKDLIDKAYLDLLDWTRTQLKVQGKSLPLHGYLPHYLDKAIAEAAIQKLDQAHIAVGWREAPEIFGRSATELEFGSKHATPVYINVLTVPPDQGDPGKTSFHGTTIRYMAQQLAVADAMISADKAKCKNFAGFSTFDKDSLTAISHGVPIVDHDGDGIENTVDTDLLMHSDAFSDGITSGYVIDSGGLSIEIQDADDSGVGVIIIAKASACGATGQARITVPCLTGFDEVFPAGRSEFVTCQP